jgi:hypothetical protein
MEFQPVCLYLFLDINACISFSSDIIVDGFTIENCGCGSQEFLTWSHLSRLLVMNGVLTAALIQTIGRQSVRFGHVNLYCDCVASLMLYRKMIRVRGLLQDNFVLHYDLVEKKPSLPSAYQIIR